LIPWLAGEFYFTDFFFFCDSDTQPFAWAGSKKAIIPTIASSMASAKQVEFFPGNEEIGFF
jgi:hypothetical protein